MYPLGNLWGLPGSHRLALVPASAPARPSPCSHCWRTLHGVHLLPPESSPGPHPPPAIAFLLQGTGWCEHPLAQKVTPVFTPCLKLPSHQGLIFLIPSSSVLPWTRFLSSTCLSRYALLGVNYFKSWISLASEGFMKLLFPTIHEKLSLPSKEFSAKGNEWAKLHWERRRACLLDVSSLSTSQLVPRVCCFWGITEKAPSSLVWPFPRSSQPPSRAKLVFIVTSRRNLPPVGLRGRLEAIPGPLLSLGPRGGWTTWCFSNSTHPTSLSIRLTDVCCPGESQAEQ